MAGDVRHRYGAQLERLLAIQRQVADIHPWLAKAFPIALVEGDQFYIYNVSNGAYGFAVQAPTPMPMPVGVRAAFPLECLDDRPACIVTGEVFDTLDGYATILHEFVHCQQSETCESRLKETLGVARQAKARGDYMWEIAHPFPYEDLQFVETYAALLSALQAAEERDVYVARAHLTAQLSAHDHEYMVWQEWKEGFARYVENQVKERLGLDGNHGGSVPPFSRVSFYEGGSRLSAFLGAREPHLISDPEALFYRMRNMPTGGHP